MRRLAILLSLGLCACTTYSVADPAHPPIETAHQAARECYLGNPAIMASTGFGLAGVIAKTAAGFDEAGAMNACMRAKGFIPN